MNSVQIKLAFLYACVPVTQVELACSDGLDLSTEKFDSAFEGIE